MKKSLLGVLVIGLIAQGAIASTGFAQDAKGLKIGYVDLNRALNEVEEGKQAKANLEADGKAKQQKLEIKQKELKAQKEAYDKQRPILSDEARREKEGNLQKSFVELQKLSQDFEKEFASKEGELTKPIAEKLKIVVADIAKNGGYAVVLPKDIVLYGAGGTDLTDEVVKRYNAKK
ncbi:MAG: OmpH family outer membrane protein [Deltaproteobacteria bacterium]|nr:OmpH family outer membrane protein [Deltaproteobacteria bacterium]